MDIPPDHVTHFGSFCDEFGHADDPRKKYLGIAGLLGRSDMWSAFDAEWKKIQQEEHIPNPFHMTDFVHHTENFKCGWESEDKRIGVLLRLLAAIERAEVMPVAASVLLQDFKSLTPEQQARLRHPYFIASQEVTSHLAFAAAVSATASTSDFLNVRVNMTYAKLRGYTGPAEELWNEFKTANLSGHWMGSYVRGDPADFSPLQAADIWAYSLGHVGEHQPAKKKEAQMAYDLFVGMALQNVSTGRFFTLFDRDEMLARLSESPFDTGPAAAAE